MNPAAQVAITGLGVSLPGLTNIRCLLTLQRPLPPATFDPTAQLGRHGLRYKNKATKLALCAVHDAVLDARLPAPTPDDALATGVVVSSNFGNVNTVCRMVETVRRGSVEDLSPMDVPNASSNVIATTIAIRFDCRAVNLMLCNGASSGLDALYMAANVIKAGRARRMLVVGVEPNNETVTRLIATAQEEGPSRPDRPLRPAMAAACMVLEAADAALERQASIYGALAGYAHTPPSVEWGASVRRLVDEAPVRPSLWLLPDQSWPQIRDVTDGLLTDWAGDRPQLLALDCTLGHLYGALGVFQGVVSCLWLQARGGHSGRVDQATLATSGGAWGDGMAALLIRRVVTETGQGAPA